MRPFSREAELLKPAPNPVFLQRYKPQQQCQGRLSAQISSEGRGPCETQAGQRRGVTSPNSEEKVRELWEELMENSCLDLLRNNGTPGCLLQTTVFYKPPADPGHSSKISGVN